MANDNTEFHEKDSEATEGSGIWLRGLWMLVFAALFAIAETVLFISAVLQFCWMLFAKEKNGFLADFGGDLGKWLADTAAFQTARSEDKPFPWRKWGS